MLADLSLPWWWYILPAYLSIWSLVFGIWNFVDGTGMFKAFKINFKSQSVVDAFIIKNSAARYLGIAAALILGIWVFQTSEAVLTALIARLAMDALDLIAGLQTGLLEKPIPGAIQSSGMFLAPVSSQSF